VKSDPIDSSADVGTITEYPVPTENSTPRGMVLD